MRYLPHTPDEIDAMLQVTGKKSLDDLFAIIPESCRIDGELQLPDPLNEWDLNTHMENITGSMGANQNSICLIGAGSYHHHIPETVQSLMSRSEFLTAYTPYQPEMAQGTLQGIFEYQTLTARLLGMDVANASMYDGGSALAEALLMGLRVKKKKKTVAVSSAIHPHYRQVVETYLKPTNFDLIELPLLKNGRTDLSALENITDLAAVALQSPNFFGIIEDLEAAAPMVHGIDALFITCFSEPLAYGLYKNPGTCGADIVCGEGQSFGIPRSFGGPGLGMFGCREKFTRSMPGRLVGETKDLDGRRGYVLTLATREQHIRREKATSNICSNQGICAMTAGMHMASLGGTGIRELARLNYDKANYLKRILVEAGARVCFDSPIFNEFAVEFPQDFKPIHERLLQQKIVAGLPLETYYPEMDGCYLFCATETVSKEAMDRIADEVKA